MVKVINKTRNDHLLDFCNDGTIKRSCAAKASSRKTKKCVALRSSSSLLWPHSRRTVASSSSLSYLSSNDSLSNGNEGDDDDSTDMKSLKSSEGNIK